MFCTELGSHIIYWIHPNDLRIFSRFRLKRLWLVGNSIVRNLFDCLSEISRIPLVAKLIILLLEPTRFSMLQSSSNLYIEIRQNFKDDLYYAGYYHHRIFHLHSNRINDQIIPLPILINHITCILLNVLSVSM